VWDVLRWVRSEESRDWRFEREGRGMVERSRVCCVCCWLDEGWVDIFGGGGWYAQ